MPKKFIDKKKATTYKLVYRSQDDPLAFEEGASDRVFVEVGKSGQLKNKGKVLDPDQTMEQSLRDLNLDDIPEEDLDEPRDAGQAALYGVYLDDRDYDYTKHLRKVGSGGGVMLEAPGAKKEQAAGIQFTDDGETVAGSSKFAMPAELLPSQHHMDIKAEAFPTGLQPNMNPNLREALEALEDEDVEEFDDDFFDQLNSDQAPEGAEMEDEYDEFQDDEDFDPDDVFAHVRRLKAQRKYDSDSEPEYSDDEREAASDFSMSSSAMFRNDKLSLLDDQFDAVEAMYEREESDSEDERYDSDGHGIVEYDSDGNVKSISTRPDFQNVME
ncbi:Protein ltv1, partial [Linderina macrospora]